MLPLRTLGFLCLMFSSCGAESTCPSDLSLLIKPAEVVGEYGHLLPVDCSSTTDKHELYWNVSNEEDVERDIMSVSLNLSLSEYDISAQCRMMLNDSHECHTDLEITVYKIPEVVSSIKHVNAQGEETQYDLGCDVLNVAPVQNLTVTWYKNNETAMTTTFNGTVKTPVNETIALSINISRSEQVVHLRCEARLDFGPQRVQLPVVVSQTHNVSTLFAPEMKLENRTERISVSEGENVTLNCDAEGNPPPVFNWACDGVDLLEKTNILTYAPVNAATICICRATNHLGNTTEEYYIDMQQKVSRADLPIVTTAAAKTPRECPLTLTPPKVVARFGDPILVVCNTSAMDAAGMGWESSVNGTGFESPPNVSLFVAKLEDWKLLPFCYITLKNGTQCHKPLPILLYKTPDNVSVSGPDQDLIEGHQFQLKCNIINVAPTEKLRVVWYRDNQVIPTRSFFEESRTPVNVTQTLNTTAERGSVFRCEAVLDLGPDGLERFSTLSLDYTTAVQYKPLFENCLSQYYGVENDTLDKFHCQVDGNPTPTVQWYYEGKVFDSLKPLSRNDTGKYTIQIGNIHGNSSKSVAITVEYGPSFTCEDRYEVKIEPHIQTPCEPKGVPPPTLTWFKDGKKVAQWTKNASGEYELEANNKHGVAKHKVYLDIQYAPEIKERNGSMEVTEGENVTLDCNAEGNPPPVVAWRFTSRVTPEQNTEWRHKTITVTAATSTSAVVYSCSATNKVGEVTRTVTLVIKGKSGGVPIAVIWVCLIIPVTIVFLLVICLYKRQKAHGRYSFLPARIVSDIPLS
ncbi:unnamed protein product [Ophioblennius macclurei]